MPQSIEELRAEWQNSAKAIDHLQRAGYSLTTGFEWVLPDCESHKRHWGKSELVTEDPDVILSLSPEIRSLRKELRAIRYLMAEFDYGGVYMPNPVNSIIGEDKDVRKHYKPFNLFPGDSKCQPVRILNKASPIVSREMMVYVYNNMTDIPIAATVATDEQFIRVFVGAKKEEKGKLDLESKINVGLPGHLNSFPVKPDDYQDTKICHPSSDVTTSVRFENKTDDMIRVTTIRENDLHVLIRIEKIGKPIQTADVEDEELGVLAMPLKSDHYFGFRKMENRNIFKDWKVMPGDGFFTICGQDFDINLAKEILKDKPRKNKQLVCAHWQGMANWFTPTKFQSDFRVPVICVRMLGNYMPIDGWTRIRHALASGIPILPMVILTHEESKAVTVTAE